VDSGLTEEKKGFFFFCFLKCFGCFAAKKNAGGITERRGKGSAACD